MPSHIFTRVGAWSESVATNERSAVAAKQDKDFDEQLHAMDYLVYAYLQLARDDDARRVMDDLGGHPMGIGLFLAFDGPRMHGNAHRFFRPIKEAMDPGGRINYGKMHEIRTRFSFPGLRRIPLTIARLPLRLLGRLKAITPKRDRFVRKYTEQGGRR